MIGSPAISLDRKRVRQCDADDLVAAMLQMSRERHERLALFVLASGEFKVTTANGPGFDYLSEHEPRAFVGSFGPDAFKVDVLEAVWKRCEQIGMEWPR